MKKLSFSYQWKQNKIWIQAKDGRELTVEIIENDVIHICEGKKQERSSYAVNSEMTGEISSVSAGEDVTGKDILTIESPLLSLHVQGDLNTEAYWKDGTLMCRDYQGKRMEMKSLSDEELEQMAQEGHAVHGGTGRLAAEVVKELTPDTVFYGLGDKTGFLNKRGYDYEMWNSDNPDPQLEIPAFRAMYKSIPFLIAHTGNGAYGIFYDNPNRTYWDLGYEDNGYYYFGAQEGGLDYYILGGRTIAKVIGQYTRLTGTAPLPQLWTLGYQQSRWSYMSEEEVMELAGNFRKYGIPCDAIHLDIDYMEDFKVFTWNKETFPNPKEFTEKLARWGIKIVTIIDPGTKVEKGYDVYDTGIKEGYFAKAADGTVYENVVWPGDSVYPDFTSAKVREWWGGLQKRMVDAGVRGIWNDMNEPASFCGPLPDDVQFSDEDGSLSHKEVHNVYGHLMAKATYDGLKKHDGRRPFVITRACYSGSQKYATAWTGDNHSIWAHLQMSIPQLCNLGMSGMPFVGTDVGGFGSNTTPELLARWVQVGCFSPLFRNHSAKYTRRQEPWQFGKEVMEIYRKFVNLRYHLIPYYYDLFWEHTKNGLPIMRPLVLSYEKDENVYECNDEFMIGTQILVAPVVQQGARSRSVYLPKGRWVSYFDGQWYEGGRHIAVKAPLDTCPVFIRDKSILPVYPYGQLQSVDQAPKDILYLRVWDSENSEHKVVYETKASKTSLHNACMHYQDNGEDFACQEGAYNTYLCSMDAEGTVHVQLCYHGYEAYQNVKLL